jgi:type I restriction enzyme, S subunit
MTIYKTKTIREVTNTLIDYRGKTPEKSTTGVKLITAKVIKDGFIVDDDHEYIADENYDAWMRRGLPHQWDILLTTEAPLGEVAQLRTSERVALAQRVILLRGDPSSVNQNYFFHALKSPFVQAGLRARSSGTTVLGIKQSELWQVEIPCPPLRVQERIASILSAYDDLVENNTRRIKILEEIAQVTYREWFVNFRFPGHKRIKMVESEIGRIPDGWRMVELADLYKTGSGGTPSRKVDEYFGGSIPWVKTRELTDGFIIDTEEKITESGLKCSSAKLFPPRTVLMAMYGATIGKLGMLTSEASCNQACCAISENVESIGAEYIFLTLRHKRDDIIGLRMGAAQQNISQEVIRSIRLLRPKEEAISSFNQLARAIFDELRVLTQKNINLRKTRDLLLPKLMSGEISLQHMETEAVAQGV